MKKERLDVVMIDRGLVESRSMAQRLIMAGQVRVEDQVVLKPAVRIDIDSRIMIDRGPRFVSRGGEKLLAALRGFNLLDLHGLICVDVGASTGGFTDCLLQHGAKRVYAIDVGYGLLHWKLRQDERVVIMEKTNARFVGGFEEKIDLVTVDASFISLRVILPVIYNWFLAGDGIVIALIKPQFEAGRKDAARGDGVIRDPNLHRRILQELLEYAQTKGFGIKGLIRSPLIGPKGNIEFLVRLDVNQPTTIDLHAAIQTVIADEELPST